MWTNSLPPELLNTVHCMDCLEFMKTLPDKSISLVCVDPPYFEVMKKCHKWIKYERDKQRGYFEDYLKWREEITVELFRVTKDNWSVYCFWDDKIIAYIQVVMDKYFELENNIVRHKPNNMTIKWWTEFNSYATVTERLLFYSKEKLKSWLQSVYENPECFRSIKEYMRGEKQKIKSKNKWNSAKFDEYINDVSWTSSVVSRHYFPDSQWVFPTEDIYRKLQTTWFFTREYEELRREYEELRRCFTPEENYTDVWTFNILSWWESVEHPTQKPLQIIKRIINTSSRKWDIILDCFAWSWTTWVACKELWRNYILVEKEPKYVDIIHKRLQNTTVSLFHS